MVGTGVLLDSSLFFAEGQNRRYAIMTKKISNTEFRALLSQHEPLIRHMAESFSGMNQEDLVQEGRIALWKCAERWEGRNGATFLTFAKRRILGTFLDLATKSSTDAASPNADSEMLYDIFDKDNAPEMLSSPEEEILERGRSRITREAIAALPEKDRALLQSWLSEGTDKLAKAEGLSQRAIQIRIKNIINAVKDSVRSAA